MKSIFKINPDTAGFFTSMLCAIHCSAVPLLISMGLLSTGTWLHNHMIDWVVICTGIVIASYSLVGDFIRKHRNYLPLLLASFGFLFLLLGMIEHHGWMLVLSVMGGLMVASAHMLNHRIGAVRTVKN
jgi:MerC mercury resistance protein